MISLTHFKGHEEAGFGGAMKNSGAWAPVPMQASGRCIPKARPEVDQDKCVGCGTCAKYCAHDGPQMENGKMHIDWTKCMGCGRCIDVCPVKAIHSAYAQSTSILNCKIAEYTRQFWTDVQTSTSACVRDVSPYCDCHPENDVPIVPDVGMFASFDPVALDLACAEAVNAQTAMPNSKLAKANRPDLDNLTGSFRRPTGAARHPCQENWLGRRHLRADSNLILGYKSRCRKRHLLFAIYRYLRFKMSN